MVFIIHDASIFLPRFYHIKLQNGVPSINSEWFVRYFHCYNYLKNKRYLFFEYDISK